jgi:uncharacterized membrane protein YqaE (UPF0057 family)
MNLDNREGYDKLENKILDGRYDLFDKVCYGGVCHGITVLPDNLFKVIFSVLFPPIGEILNIVSGYVLDEFPYITWDTLKVLFANFQRIIYSIVLTSLFYIPGLVYTLSGVSCKNDGPTGIVRIRRY